MDDDWRLRIDVHEHGAARSLVERLDTSELEHRLESAFHNRVIVSREHSDVFLYASTREQAERAQELARSLATEHGWQVDFELRRWHPTAEEWEEPDKPLPATDQQRLDEHAELIASERHERIPEFEVRVECSSRKVARELTERLRREGLRCVQHYRYVLVGATDEDDAKQLADRIRAEVPSATEVTPEGTIGSVLAAVGPNPFAIFGGLGG